MEEKTDLVLTGEQEEHLNVANLSIPQDISSNQTKFKRCIETSSQVFLGLVGSAAGFLYLGASETCAKSLTCGKWLSDLIKEGPATSIFFSTGGVVFSLMNIYFSAKSIQIFFEYLQKQNSDSAKAIKGTSILIYALSQNAPPLLVSLSTNTQVWQTVLAVSGNAPGALYGTVGLIENELPLILSKFKFSVIKISHFFVDRCYPLDEVNSLYRERLNYYERLQRDFIRKLRANFTLLTSKLRKIESVEHEDPLKFLFEQHADIQEDASLGIFLTRIIGKFFGFSLTSIFLSAFLANTFKTLANSVPTLFLQLTLTLILYSSAIYSSFKITMGGVSGFIDALLDMINQKPINSLVLQLRPNTTMGVLALGLIPSCLSYSLMHTLFKNEFPEKSIAHEIALYSSDVGIIIYHFSAMFYTYHLLLSRFTQDKREQFFFLIEKESKRFEKMALEDFIEFIEKNSPSKNALYGLQPYRENREITQLLPQKTPLFDTRSMHEINKNSNKSSCFGLWCTWFSCCKSSNTDDSQHEEKMAYLNRNH